MLSSAGLCRHRVSQPAAKAAAALSQPRWALLLLCYKMRSSGFLYMACDLMAGPRLHGDGSQGARGELLEHSRGSSDLFSRHCHRGREELAVSQNKRNPQPRDFRARAKQAA